MARGKGQDHRGPEDIDICQEDGLGPHLLPDPGYGLPPGWHHLTALMASARFALICAEAWVLIVTADIAPNIAIAAICCVIIAVRLLYVNRAASPMLT